MLPFGPARDRSEAASLTERSPSRGIFNDVSQGIRERGRAPARRRGQRGAPHWTNDVDAGAGRRRLSVVEPSDLEGHSVAITRPTRSGRAGRRLPGISSRRRRRMVVFGHSHGGLTHLPDHAPSGGVMPLLELAPLL